MVTTIDVLAGVKFDPVAVNAGDPRIEPQFNASMIQGRQDMWARADAKLFTDRGGGVQQQNAGLFRPLRPDMFGQAATHFRRQLNAGETGPYDRHCVGSRRISKASQVPVQGNGVFKAVDRPGVAAITAPRHRRRDAAGGKHQAVISVCRRLAAP